MVFKDANRGQNMNSNSGQAARFPVMPSHTGFIALQTAFLRSQIPELPGSEPS